MKKLDPEAFPQPLRHLVRQQHSGLGALQALPVQKPLYKLSQL